MTETQTNETPEATPNDTTIPKTVELTIYKASGEVIQHCAVPQFQVAMIRQRATAEHLHVIEGLPNKAGYIKAGQIVPFPEQPDPAHRWDWTLMEWADPRDLATIKADKWEAIKRARRVAEVSGFYVYGIGMFDSDAKSQARITAEASRARGQGAYEGMTWTLADNSKAFLDWQDMLKVDRTLGEHLSSLHDRSQQIRAAIAAATTGDEVIALAWGD